VRQLLKSGVVSKPRWFDAVSRHPPQFPLRDPTKKRPMKIEYPEDRLLAKYYSKHPEARLEAMEIWRPQQHSAWKFVQRQLAVMKEEKLSEEDAYKKVEAEIAEVKRKLELEKQLATRQAIEFGLRRAPSLIQMIQAEEEKHLHATRGDAPVPRSEGKRHH
jgi:hypothetical protein